MGTQDAPNRPVKSVITTFDIIESVNKLDEAGVVELADHLNLSQSTVHSHLSTLVSLGYLVKKENEYQLSLKHLCHGIKARNDLGFYETARSEIKELADKIEGVVWLYTEEHGRGVVIDQANREHRVGFDLARVGWRSHLHCTSAGKAMLAYMPEARRDEIIDEHGLPKKTEQTITDYAELCTELEQIRERGYATNEEERNEGIYAIGAPIVKDEVVLGAVSVSGPGHRMQREETKQSILTHLTDTTNQIALKIRYQ